MTLKGLDATTPQLRVVEGLLNAYISLDLANLEPLTSKGFKFQTFPKIANLPDEMKEGYLKKYQAIFSLMAKAEVCIQNYRRARRLTSTSPRPMFTKRLMHRERLSSTFVSPQSSISFQIITCNNRRRSQACYIPSKATVSNTILSASSLLLRKTGGSRYPNSKISRIPRSVQTSTLGSLRLLPRERCRSMVYTCVKLNCGFEQRL